MPKIDIPSYCAKCGRTFYARYDMQTASLILWCRVCPDVALGLPFEQWTSASPAQGDAWYALVQKTEEATGMAQGAKEMRVPTPKAVYTIPAIYPVKVVTSVADLVRAMQPAAFYPLGAPPAPVLAEAQEQAFVAGKNALAANIIQQFQLPAAKLVEPLPGGATLEAWDKMERWRYLIELAKQCQRKR